MNQLDQVVAISGNKSNEEDKEYIKDLASMALMRGIVWRH